MSLQWITAVPMADVLRLKRRSMCASVRELAVPLFQNIFLLQDCVLFQQTRPCDYSDTHVSRTDQLRSFLPLDSPHGMSV